MEKIIKKKLDIVRTIVLSLLGGEKMANYTRHKKQFNLTLDDETRAMLEGMKEDLQTSASRVIDTFIQLWKDFTFDEASLPFVNRVRVKLGRKPLKNTNRNYRDIWKD
jgi:hypothetical protein